MKHKIKQGKKEHRTSNAELGNSATQDYHALKKLENQYFNGYDTANKNIPFKVKDKVMKQNGSLS